MGRDGSRVHNFSLSSPFVTFVPRCSTMFQVLSDGGSDYVRLDNPFRIFFDVITKSFEKSLKKQKTPVTWHLSHLSHPVVSSKSRGDEKRALKRSDKLGRLSSPSSDSPFTALKRSSTRKDIPKASEQKNSCDYKIPWDYLETTLRLPWSTCILYTSVYKQLAWLCLQVYTSTP